MKLLTSITYGCVAAGSAKARNALGPLWNSNTGLVRSIVNSTPPSAGSGCCSTRIAGGISGRMPAMRRLLVSGAP